MHNNVLKNNFRYTHTYPDRIKNENNGDIACDSYSKWKEDIQLLKDLGVDHYRLSLSWSRILPNGTINNVNQKGIDYYINVLEVMYPFLFLTLFLALLGDGISDPTQPVIGCE